MSYNMCYYENPEFDQLIHDALATADESRRAELYATAQDLIWEECPLISVCIDDNTWATSNKITDVKVYPDGAVNLRNGKMAQ